MIRAGRSRMAAPKGRDEVGFDVGKRRAADLAARNRDDVDAGAWENGLAVPPE